MVGSELYQGHYYTKESLFNANMARKTVNIIVILGCTLKVLGFGGLFVWLGFFVCFVFSILRLKKERRNCVGME